MNKFLTVQDIEKYYLDNIVKYGVEAPRTMGYRSAPIDDRLIVNILPLEVPESYSVLDVGCGLGQIVPILKSKFPTAVLAQLVGLDLVDEFVYRCAEQFTQYQFFSANFLEWESQDRFDLVLAAGVLVTRIFDFESYLESFIAKMVLASKCWIGFNVVGSCGPSYTAKHIATISQERLTSMLKQFTNVKWELEGKEVFPGSEEVFIRGRKIIS